MNKRTRRLALQIINKIKEEISDLKINSHLRMLEEIIELDKESMERCNPTAEHMKKLREGLEKYRINKIKEKNGIN